MRVAAGWAGRFTNFRARGKEVAGPHSTLAGARA